MENNDLKFLSRQELLELLISQKKKNDELEKKLAETKKALEDKTITLTESGSIAEAALRLSGIFETAQSVADEYKANVRLIADAQISEADERAKEIVANAEADAKNSVRHAALALVETVKKLELEGEDSGRVREIAADLIHRYGIK